MSARHDDRTTPTTDATAANDARTRTSGPSCTSRLPGFYQRGLSQRLDELAQASGVDRAQLERALGPGGLDVLTADTLIENVVGVFGLPFAVGLNLRVNQVDRLVPMVIEEPSIVAAFSRVARMVRSAGGGFAASAEPALMVAQVHLADVSDLLGAVGALESAAARISRVADACVPRLCARGGGVRRVSYRPLTHAESGQRFLSVHLHLDVVDAMGANLANTVAEGVASLLEELTGGRVVMCILSNLADERLARAQCELPYEALAFGGVSGPEAAKLIEEGWRIADIDPYRAVTHNKGVMNGIDAAATALGQDVRALEAGAHAWAARDGRVRPLSRFVRDREREHLRCELTIPLAVSTVGPLRTVHPGVTLAHRLLGCERARDLAAVLATIGLAQSLGAVQALVTEGIQRGHMRLHARKQGDDEAS